MKRTISLLLTAVLTLSLCGCGGASAVRAQDLTAQYEPGQVSVTTAPGLDPEQTAADFAVRLLQNQVGGDSVLVSPLSVLFALGMTMNGAAGDTLLQMEQTLGFTRSDLNAYLYACRAWLSAEENGVSLADSVWLRDEEGRLQVKPDFLQAVRSYYDAGIFSAPFDGATCRDINNWVKEHTDGMIDTILDKIPDEAVIYLINAMAFDGKWAAPFEKNDVYDAAFTTEAGQQQTVPFMHATESYYLSGAGAKGVLKYYDNGCAFAALLPEEGVSVEEFVSSLTGEKLRQILSDAAQRRVRCALPKFTLDYSTDLADVLPEMGMTDLFDPALADLSAMATSARGNLFVSRVLHKTHIAVDEEGTKAAAVTAVEVRDECAAVEEDAVEVTLNRPFVYLLLSADTMTPLFIGTVMDVA